LQIKAGESKIEGEEKKQMKNYRFLSRILSFALVLTAALCGCSSTPPEQTDGVSAPGGVGSLTGTWKLTAADSSSQTLDFRADGAGTFTLYDPQGEVTRSSDLTYAFDEDTRFGLVGRQWVVFIPCEVRGSQLTLKTTGEVFTKQ
jgi:hypothetical protein